MRIMFTTFPGLGHFLPVVPLAWAARANGHEVLVMTTGPALEACRKAGLPCMDASPAVNVMMEFQTGLRERFQGRPMSAGGRTGAFDPMSNPEFSRVVAERMAAAIDQMTDRTVQVAKEWRPDLVVHTPIEGAGSIAAEILSIPSVLHGIGAVGLSAMLAGKGIVSQIYDALAPTFQRYGLGDRPRSPITALEISPPSISGPCQSPAWSMRYIPYNGGGELPEWLVEKTVRPRICVTLGTVIPRSQGVSALGGVIEAVRDLDAEVILALGGADSSALGDLPANVRTTGWIPLSALAPTCQAIVHHGGSGTTMNALVAGIPQLVIPHMADQHANAAALKRRGVGVSFLQQDITPEALYKGLQQLLIDSDIAVAVKEVSREIATLPSPAEILSRLLKLVH